jgi:hypothetical protein
MQRQQGVLVIFRLSELSPTLVHMLRLMTSGQGQLALRQGGLYPLGNFCCGGCSGAFDGAIKGPRSVQAGGPSWKLVWQPMDKGWCC